MAKKIIVEEVFQTHDKTVKNQIIRQNLIRRILDLQEREFEAAPNTTSEQVLIT
jgi:hypothetical protein